MLELELICVTINSIFVTGNLYSSCSCVHCSQCPNTSFNIIHCAKRDTYSPKRFKFK